MPRGSGKTSLAEVAALWAILYGHHAYVILIGATEGKAVKLLNSIKTELRTNEGLLADFPEVVYPIHKLEGINNRAAGQLYNGKSTAIGWKAKTITLPTVPDSPASGAILEVSGITGAVRGAKNKKTDGTTVRPTLAIIDDPQTDRSAKSVVQCEQREELIAGAILGLAGPGEKMAAIMPCTVIREDDAADRLLNRKLHPEWNGERTQLIYSFPTDQKLWDRYAELRAEGMRNGDNGRAATDFYRANRQAMDAGSDPAWPERYNDDELSATQHAVNLKLRNPATFAAEMQNAPIVKTTSTIKELTADQIAAKLNRVPRGEVPAAATTVTGFVDVQGEALYWLVAAWAPDFSGSVLDYGTWPDQHAQYFTLTDLRHTIQDEFDGMGLEGQLYAALGKLIDDDLAAREWKRQDGLSMRLDRCLVDANWGTSTNTVYQFCREAKSAAILLPSHGRFIGAVSKPMSQYQDRPGERKGDEWIVSRPENKRAIRHVSFDANHWKTFIHARLATAQGDRGSLALFGDEPAAHRQLSHHIKAEIRYRVEARGRTVDEWKLPPHKPDNHWFDGLVGSAVGASIHGCQLLEKKANPAPPPKRPAKRVSYL